ncbi:MAG: hypothetical protein U0527_13625 [Candidatus Eisenbacteria bacterium]
MTVPAVGHAVDVANRRAANSPCSPALGPLRGGDRVRVERTDGHDLQGTVLECRCESDSLLLLDVNPRADLLDRGHLPPFLVRPGDVVRVERLDYRFARAGLALGIVADVAVVLYALSFFGFQ